MLANFQDCRNYNNVSSILFYILLKLMNRKQFTEIDIMISYSYENIVVSIIIINLL